MGHFERLQADIFQSYSGPPALEHLSASADPEDTVREATSVDDSHICLYRTRETTMRILQYSHTNP